MRADKEQQVAKVFIMRLYKLKKDDIERVLDLFCDCFADDHYYLTLFKHYSDKRSAMRTLFREGIQFCIDEGLSIGIKDNDELIAFALLFDYKTVKQSKTSEFNILFGIEGDLKVETKETGIHQLIGGISGNILYLLTIAVSKSYRRCGLASGMVDLILERYSEYNVVSDVSNKMSLEMYRQRNFTVDTVGDDYYLVIHKKQATTSLIDYSGPVRLIVPSCSVLDKYKINYTLERDKWYVLRCDVADSCGIDYFSSNDECVCSGVIVGLDYDALLQYQRVINLSLAKEFTSGNSIYYINRVGYEEKPLVNDTLAKMLECRSSEWSLIPDVLVSIPFEYSDLNKIEHAAIIDERQPMLEYMTFRTLYEAGIPSNIESVDDLAGLKKRIKRYYLGKLKLQITSEMTTDNYETFGDPIGPGAFVDYYISIDTESNCAVLTWYSLSAPFLISHLFDTVIRNQLMVLANGSIVIFYDYVKGKFGIIKRGTPKIFSVFPYDKNVLKKSQLGSLLMAETIYPDGENYGGIIDNEIMSIVNNENGMGQYDRAHVFAYTNTVLQFSKDFKGSIIDRLCEESIALYYIELILFEEAAIHIADQSIIELFTETAPGEPIDFLSRVDAINDRYSKTIYFWDIKVNYPSSQKSIDMMRNSFRIKEQLEEMRRNRDQLQIAFDTKSDIIDRKDSRRMDTSLAVISFLAIFSAWIDGHDYLGTWSDYLSQDTIHILQKALFVVVLLLAGYAFANFFKNRTGIFGKKKSNSRCRKKGKENSNIDKRGGTE